jgi:hypothetical protein
MIFYFGLKKINYYNKLNIPRISNFSCSSLLLQHWLNSLSPVPCPHAADTRPKSAASMVDPDNDAVNLSKIPCIYEFIKITEIVLN